jgi:hypothetical protein
MCHITENVFSDLSKDVDGFRPTLRMEWFRGLTNEAQGAELRYLNSCIVALRREEEEEAQIQTQRTFGATPMGNAFSALRS